MAKRASKRTIEELSKVKHVGPAKARAIAQKLGIKSVEELYDASKNGKLQTVSGVGPALSKKIHSAAEETLGSRQTPSPSRKPKGSQKKNSKTAHPAAEAAQKAAEATETVEARAAKTAEAVKAKAAKTAEAVAGRDVPPTPEATRSAPRATTGPDKQYVDQFVPTLRCPACGHDDFDRGATTLTCTACRREYNFHNGVADLAPPKPSGRSVTQRVMESRFYARFYEDVMRPRLTGVVTKRSLEEEYKLAAEMLELDETTKLLDVAAGTGNFTRHFAQRLADTFDDDHPLLVGMDLSWPMLETARTYLRRDGFDNDVFLIRGDATRIPARRAAFNRLHCAGALHMMQNIDEALRNFARVLEPNGICVISSFLLGDGFFRRLAKRAAELPTQFHWFTRDELHQRMRRAGFEVVDDSVAGDAITVKARRT